MSDSSLTENSPTTLGLVFCATPITRKPSSLSDCTFASTASFRSFVNGVTVPPRSINLEMFSISSIAPFVIICVLPAGSATTTLIRRRSKSKGSSSILWKVWSRSRTISCFLASLSVRLIMARSIRFFKPVWK